MPRRSSRKSPSTDLSKRMKNPFPSDEPRLDDSMERAALSPYKSQKSRFYRGFLSKPTQNPFPDNGSPYDDNLERKFIAPYESPKYTDPRIVAYRTGESPFTNRYRDAMTEEHRGNPEELLEKFRYADEYRTEQKASLKNQIRNRPKDVVAYFTKSPKKGTKKSRPRSASTLSSRSSASSTASNRKKRAKKGSTTPRKRAKKGSSTPKKRGKK